MTSKKFENKSGWFVGGGIIASVIASLCCIGPLVFTILGVSGAAALTKFEVVRTPMLLLVIILFSIAGVSLYRKRKLCEPGSICADPRKFKKMTKFFWFGLVIAVLAIASPQWVAWLFS